MSTSVSTVRGLHYDIAERVLERADPKLSSSSTTDNIFQSTPSNTGSMTSVLILPSPPDSPSLSPVHSVQHSPSFDSLSESSLPSVSSSFFFSSSAAGSPGRSRNGSYPQSEQGQDKEHSVQDIGALALIIPSLTLPPALRQPTPFGQTLGSLRLLVLGAQGAGKSFLTGLLLEDNEDVVEVGTWEDWEEFDGSFGFGKVLKASTDWLDRRDSYGSERYEPTRNVHIVELPGYSQDANVSRNFAGWKYRKLSVNSIGYRANNASERHYRGAVPCAPQCPSSRYTTLWHAFKSSRVTNVTILHRNGFPFAIQYVSIIIRYYFHRLMPIISPNATRPSNCIRSFVIHSTYCASPTSWSTQGFCDQSDGNPVNLVNLSAFFSDRAQEWTLSFTRNCSAAER